MKRIKEILKEMGTKELCMGEVYTMEKLNLLKDLKEPKKEIDKILLDIFVYSKLENKNYISNELCTKYCKRLKTLFNSKTEKTKIKRIISILNEYASHKTNIFFRSDRDMINRAYELAS